MRLEAAALLPVEEFPQARRAQELLGLLFPEGARFLARRYPEQLAEMDLRLRRIDAEKLAKDLDALCDPAYLKFIRKIHPQYQAMAQAAHLATESKAESLFHHVQALRQAIIEYATKVCASADSDEPATVRRAQTALRPLEVEREQRAQRGGGPGEPPEPEPAPAPPSPG